MQWFALDFQPARCGLVLTKDIPAPVLQLGHMGAVAEVHGLSVFEVGGVDNDDRTCATLPVKSRQLFVLYYQLA